MFTSSADWVLFGGAAGGGKTHALTYDPLRHCQGPHAQRLYRGAIFRRTFPELSQPGGLLDHCKEHYGRLGARYNHQRAEFAFPSGAKISLNTLQFEKDLNDYLGAQFDGLYVDEANSFSFEHIRFLWSRCRSQCGVRPSLRMSSNPDADSFLFRMLGWWLDGDTGYPIKSRAGQIRHFRPVGKRDESGNAELEWFEEPQFEDVGGERKCVTTSFTFIPAVLSDNEHLERSDPGYRVRLMQLDEASRARYLGGCWLSTPRKGTEWPADWFLDCWCELEDYPVPKHREVVRMFAVDASKGRRTTSGDYSSIVCLAQTKDLGYVDASIARRPPDQIVADLFSFCDQEHHRIRSGDLLGIESLQFQELFVGMVLRYAKDHPHYALSQWLKSGNSVIPVEDSLPKAMRIRRLTGPLSKREWRFLKNPGTSLLVSQLRTWDGTDRKGQYDDGPDSLDMARQLPSQRERAWREGRLR
jgi:hypothetical protein